MAIQPSDLGASIAKSVDRDTAQQARQGAPTDEDRVALRQLAEAKRRQIRQPHHPERVEPRRDANQQDGRGRQRRHEPKQPKVTEDEEHHFDALA